MKLNAVIGLGVATLVTVVLAGAASPATANAAGGYFIQSAEDRRLCLADSLSSGVRLGSCNASANWDIWIGGWTRNRVTGRCLRATTRVIHTGGCSQTDRFAFWRYWSGGWYQRVGSDAVCLSRLVGFPHSVTIKACTNPTGAHPRERWWVFPVA